MIPGAEYAPTIAVGYVTEQGGFYTSIEDIPKIRRVDTGELIPDAHIEARRQLTVTDPDDQRVIWRLAAGLQDANEEEQQSALLMRSATDPRVWILRVKSLREGPRHLLRVGGATMAEATAALCSHLWGPERTTP